MLPPSELEISVGEEDFSEDIEDAYGEIANIMTGVYSLAFEEQYPEQIRVVKTGVEPVVPMKVETDSDDPMPNQLYYMSSMAASAEDKDLGRLRLLFPASVLHLEQGQEELQATGETASKTVEGQATQPGGAETGQPAAAQPDGTAGLKVDPAFNLSKHHAKVDKILEECRKRVQSEVGELLGAEISLDGPENKLVNKEDFFFEEVSGKQVLANMDVVGDEESSSYLFVSLKDAIYSGGILIMLPNAELESAVAEEEFKRRYIRCLWGNRQYYCRGIHGGI